MRKKVAGPYRGRAAPNRKPQATTARQPRALAHCHHLADQVQLPPDKPLTLVAYETCLTVRTYVTHVAVGDALAELPLFLEPAAQVPVPLEETYNAAFAAVPRWSRRSWQGANQSQQPRPVCGRSGRR